MMNEQGNINSMYADYTNVTFNLYNFSLYFGSIEENGAQVFGKVKMSPEAMKQFADLLQKNIKIYEETYGKINEFTEEVEKKEKAMVAALKQAKEEKEAEKMEEVSAQ